MLAESHLYSNCDSGLAEETKQIPCPHNLTHIQSRPVHQMRRQVIWRPETDT